MPAENSWKTNYTFPAVRPSTPKTELASDIPRAIVATANTKVFFFIIYFCKLLITTKVSLIDSWSIYDLIGKFLTHLYIYIIKFDNCSRNAWAGAFSSTWKAAWKTRETDNEARILTEAEMKRKPNRNQKRITPSDIHQSSLIFLLWQKNRRNSISEARENRNQLIESKSTIIVSAARRRRDIKILCLSVRVRKRSI